jgi:hypothetical protein
VATPKAAESVNSLSIAGRDEIFLATKIVFRFVTLVVTPARWLGGRVYQKPELLVRRRSLPLLETYSSLRWDQPIPWSLGRPADRTHRSGGFGPSHDPMLQILKQFFFAMLLLLRN